MIGNQEEIDDYINERRKSQTMERTYRNVLIGTQFKLHDILNKKRLSRIEIQKIYDDIKYILMKEYQKEIYDQEEKDIERFCEFAKTLKNNEEKHN